MTINSLLEPFGTLPETRLVPVDEDRHRPSTVLTEGHLEEVMEGSVAERNGGISGNSGAPWKSLPQGKRRQQRWTYWVSSIFIVFVLVMILRLSFGRGASSMDEHVGKVLEAVARNSSIAKSVIGSTIKDIKCSKISEPKPHNESSNMLGKHPKSVLNEMNQCPHYESYSCGSNSDVVRKEKIYKTEVILPMHGTSYVGYGRKKKDAETFGAALAVYSLYNISFPNIDTDPTQWIHATKGCDFNKA